MTNDFICRQPNLAQNFKFWYVYESCNKLYSEYDSYKRGKETQQSTITARNIKITKVYSVRNVYQGNKFLNHHYLGKEYVPVHVWPSRQTLYRERLIAKIPVRT